MASSSRPTLASVLWASQLNAKKPMSRLSSGLPKFDDALNGGLEYGHTCCISAEVDACASDITLAWMVSHLASDSQATVVAILDATTNTLDVRRLRDRLIEALSDVGLSSESARKEALSRLKQVTIMKVFDFAGMAECLVELREKLGSSPSTGLKVSAAQEIRSTVPDSESDDDGNLEDPPPQRESSTTTDPARAWTSTTGRGMVLVGNLTHLVAAPLRNNHVRGQAFLVSFMRSLRHLTHAHNLCTILTANTFTHPVSRIEQSVSIFSSCRAVPTLGQAFSHVLDVHLLAHLQPKTAEDARVMYSKSAEERRKGIALATVVEVLQDRHGKRVGRWAAMETDGEGRLKPV